MTSKVKLTRIARLVTLGFALASAAPVHASQQALMELFKVLRDKGSLTETEYAMLVKAAQADEAQAAAAVPAVAAVATPAAAPVAVTTAAPAAPAKNAWTDNIALKGDMRTRYDYTDREEKEARGRGRLRYRLGIIATPIANLEVGAGLASGTGDPRSANQSFDQVFSGKDINLDYAYMQYGFGYGITAIAGKFSPKNYLWAPTDVMWDTDINPEGASVKYAGSNAIGGFYTQGGVWVLSESGSDDKDAYMAYAQLGQTWKSDAWFGTLAATTYVFTDLKSVDKFFAPTGAFHRGGNTDTQMNSFNLATEVGTKLGGGTASLVGEFIDNYETSTSQDLAWSVGTKYLWNQWSMKYLYADLDANAVPDFLPDSDRFEGDTGVRGHEFELQYEIIKHVALGVDYYRMKRKADKVDEHRVQADINVKF